MRSPQSRLSQRWRSARACPSVLGFGVSWLLLGPHQTPPAGLVAEGIRFPCRSLITVTGFASTKHRPFRDPIQQDVTIALTFGDETSGGFHQVKVGLVSRNNLALICM
jgi:hypothetical protein